jgi:hypothetical protein
VIIEDFIRAIPRDSLLLHMPRIEEAVRLRLGVQPAKDAAKLINNFLGYKDAVEALDRDLNARGVMPDQFSRTKMIETRKQLQDKAFGSVAASVLFKVERAGYALMERQGQELKGAQNLSPEQIQKMEAEYAALLKQEGSR